MLIGAVAAIAHGIGLPLLMLFFGDLTNSFIQQEISSAVALNVSNQTGMDVNCSSVFDYTLGNFSLPDATITMVIQSFNLQSEFECLLGGEFFSQINITVLAFVGIAVAVFIGTVIQITSFQFAAERQVYKIRLRYYRSIMRQNIAWFDANPTGELVNRLSE